VASVVNATPVVRGRSAARTGKQAAGPRRAPRSTDGLASVPAHALSVAAGIGDPYRGRVPRAFLPGPQLSRLFYLEAVRPLRNRLGWYPDNVWRYLLAAQWTRIVQEEAFVGRAAEAGDELGSRLIAARLAREVMRLCLVLARRYPPYSKWLGTAFAALPDIAVVAAAARCGGRPGPGSAAGGAVHRLRGRRPPAEPAAPR
jgi:hypothetical protein